MRTHTPLALNVDQAITGLIHDREGRGMLDETLVVWTSQFGRKLGYRYPLKAAGAIKPVSTYGESGDYGYVAAKDQRHVHGFQAAILNQMGLEHTKLTYRHGGRDFHLPGVEGHVICEILL